MRWLFVKDLQILKRSPLLVGLLVVYPIVIALMIGFALSSPPGKPKVALLNEVPTGHGQLSLGNQKVNVSKYASQLYQSIDPIKVDSRAEAIAKVQSGQAAAALIVPANIVSEINSLITQGVGNPTVDLILNTKDPLERQFADQAISSRVAQVEQAVSKQVLQVAVTDLQETLNGGTLKFLGQNVPLLGLKNSRAIVRGTIASLPKTSPLLPALRQVVSFATLAIDGLGFATPVLSSIGSPLTVHTVNLAGKTTPTDSYAAAIAVIVSLMFVGVLLAAALLALERSETHLLAAGAGTGHTRGPAVREDRRVRRRRGSGHARDVGVRVAVRPPRLGPVPALGGGARARRARVCRPRRRHRRPRP